MSEDSESEVGETVESDDDEDSDTAGKPSDFVTVQGIIDEVVHNEEEVEQLEPLSSANFVGESPSQPS